MTYLLFWIFLGISLLDGATLRHCYATWDDDPSTTIALHIHTEGGSSCFTIEYEGKGATTQCIQVPLYKKYRGGRHLYHADISGLQPDTWYQCTLRCEDKVIGHCSFHTLATHPPYRFVNAGDWENTPVAQQLATVASSYDPDAVWLGGDYPNQVSSLRDLPLWDQWLDSYAEAFYSPEHALTPMVMAIGNHEVIGGFGQPSERALFYFDWFRPGKSSYFTIPIGDAIQLIVLDSGHIASHGGIQKEWLHQVLQGAQDKSYRVALYHVPLYPGVRFTKKNWLFRSVVKGCTWAHIAHPERRLFSQPSCWGKTHWLPLFDAHHLTLALEHHDQCLKRTHRLRGDQKDPSGTLYLGDGGFGSATQWIPIQGMLHPLYAKVKGKKPCFWLIDIDDQALRCRALTLGHRQLDQCDCPARSWGAN